MVQIEKMYGTGHGCSEVHHPFWNAPGVLCGAVQELCKCLTPIVESGNQFDLEMMDVVKKDPMVPASAEGAQLSKPRAEELPIVTAPSKPTASEPEEAAQSEEFAIVPRKRPPLPCSLSSYGQMSLAHLL